MNLCFETYDIQFNTFYFYADDFQNIFLSSYKIVKQAIAERLCASSKSLPNSQTRRVNSLEVQGRFEQKEVQKPACGPEALSKSRL
jgi:hypothetical protein